MTGYNMTPKPGVNEKDIPGNRKIDLLYDREAEKFCQNCEEISCKYDIEICQCSKEFEKYFEGILNLF